MLLTQSEVAKLLRVTVRTVKRHTRDKKLEYVMVGRFPRYPITQFEDFLDSEAIIKAIRTTAEKIEKAGREGL